MSLSLTRRQKGFTLLEVIVAMVLVATLGMSLYSWVNNNLLLLSKTKNESELDRASRNAISLMQGINPLEQPTGSRELGKHTIKWSAVEVAPARHNVGHTGGRGIYEVALYDNYISIHVDGRELTRFTLRQVGYRQTQSTESLL